jgi:hypothetical protein
MRIRNPYNFQAKAIRMILWVFAGIIFLLPPVLNTDTAIVVTTLALYGFRAVFPYFKQARENSKVFESLLDARAEVLDNAEEQFRLARLRSNEALSLARGLKRKLSLARHALFETSLKKGKLLWGSEQGEQVLDLLGYVVEAEAELVLAQAACDEAEAKRDKVAAILERTLEDFSDGVRWEDEVGNTAVEIVKPIRTTRRQRGHVITDAVSSFRTAIELDFKMASLATLRDTALRYRDEGVGCYAELLSDQRTAGQAPVQFKPVTTSGNGGKRRKELQPA